MVPRHCSAEGKEPAVSVNIMQIFDIATVSMVWRSRGLLVCVSGQRERVPRGLQ